MIALTLALAFAASPDVHLEVARRKVQLDSGALALYRYSLPGRGAGRTPVLLVADLGFGREVFDFGGDGLARWLAERGFVVYVGELRGQGRSSAATGLSAIVSEELPALISAVTGGPDQAPAPLSRGSSPPVGSEPLNGAQRLRSSDQPSRGERGDAGGRIDLIVQGWAGTLALAATPVELKGRVRRVVALNTPALAEVPSELAAQFLSSGGHFSGLAARPDDFDQLFALGGAFPARTLEPLRLASTRDLSTPVAAALLEWMRGGELTLADGSTVRARLALYDRPTLQLLGIADGFANPELCSPLRDVAKAHVEVRAFSRFVHTEDYSHLSMLLGRGAARDVFPRIAAFLGEDAP